MTEIVPQRSAGVSDRLPALFQAIPESGRRFWEFFTVNIRNVHTRRAYFKAVETFAAWCAEGGLEDLSQVTPMHIAAYVEQLGRTHAKPNVKQRLAAIRMLFDWLVTGHIMETNSAHAVRGRSIASASQRKESTTTTGQEQRSQSFKTKEAESKAICDKAR